MLGPQPFSSPRLTAPLTVPDHLFVIGDRLRGGPDDGGDCRSVPGLQVTVVDLNCGPHRRLEWCR